VDTEYLRRSHELRLDHPSGYTNIRSGQHDCIRVIAARDIRAHIEECRHVVAGFGWPLMLGPVNQCSFRFPAGAPTFTPIAGNQNPQWSTLDAVGTGSVDWWLCRTKQTFVPAG
jgi:hypothetical protein